MNPVFPEFRQERKDLGKLSLANPQVTSVLLHVPVMSWQLLQAWKMEGEAKVPSHRWSLNFLKHLTRRSLLILSNIKNITEKLKQFITAVWFSSCFQGKLGVFLPQCFSLSARHRRCGKGVEPWAPAFTCALNTQVGKFTYPIPSLGQVVQRECILCPGSLFHSWHSSSKLWTICLSSSWAVLPSHSPEGILGCSDLSGL